MQQNQEANLHLDRERPVIAAVSRGNRDIRHHVVRIAIPFPRCVTAPFHGDCGALWALVACCGAARCVKRGLFEGELRAMRAQGDDNEGQRLR